MTDIQRHLKLIVNTCRELPGDIVSRLREVLPDGYGVERGIIQREDAVSFGSRFLIYDRALAGDRDEQDDTPLDLKHVLLIGSLYDKRKQKDLMSAMDGIAQVKIMSGDHPGKIRGQQTHVSQQRERIPKERLPIGFIYINEFENDLDSLIQTLSTYPVYQRPDFIFLDNLGLVQRNPLLDKRSADGYEIGLVQQDRLIKPRTCYVCKRDFQRQHFFYGSLCPDCGDLNYRKRKDRVNLSGRIALITGGRIRIGFATALKLLRNGAHVIATTRFPNDAARRFSQEEDFENWANRLDIYGLDLRFPPDVEDFVRYLYNIYPHLDILINNAAQTIGYSAAYYQPLIASEAHPLPAQLQTLFHPKFGTQDSGAVVPFVPENGPRKPLINAVVATQEKNSWVMRIDELSMPEVVEVQLINSVAPALLCGQLRGLLEQSPYEHGWIINVSSVEAQFENDNKRRGYHPHTNMAKAALNMLTRTIAADFARSNVYVNSIDPGWISDQFPSMARTHFPIDTTDAASRLCDPIFSTLQGETAVYGQFLKDYRSVSW